VQAGNWKKYPLAAARYNTALSCPWSDNQYVFRDWDDWRWWQDSEKWDGKKFGAKSTYIDHDYFNGNMEMFKSIYKISEPVPQPDPEIEKRLKAVEDELIVVNTRLDILEAVSHEHDEVPPVIPPKTTLTVEITDKHKAHYYKNTDDACDPDPGKPIMLTDDSLAPLLVGQRYECDKNLVLHCKDAPNTHTTIGNGGSLYYRIAEGTYKGKFIRADKSITWE
jgi:hypothetical protein